MNYKIFNLICVALIGIFVIGIFWVWRDGFGDVEDVGGISDVEVLDRSEVEKLKIIRLEDYDTQDKENDVENNLPIFQSSSIDIVEEKDVEDKIIKTEINLNVPFTSQAPELNWEQPWQDACEEAAVLMLDAYYKDYNLSPLFSRDEILKMVEWEEDKNWGTSIIAEDVDLLAEWYLGRDVSVVENPTIEQIKNYISNGKPVLVLAYGKDLPNPYFSGEGPEYHALVIRGYTEDKFITNDPGTKRGENFAYDYIDLMNAIHDWNDGDVENGRKVVLVVE